MRYQPHVQPLETEGFGETRDYSIAATGKAFRNLMDGLYSRKIEAVIRELTTNAYDSHIEAGTPGRQFTVHLPTWSKPLFSVRDYGVGMPHEQVMDCYSTLFSSTKDADDSRVGMLGLGSKSPFAYTDGFTLKCWDGQVCRTYASYLGAGGVPMISFAGAVSSAEPRGVEVTFAVKREDNAAFEVAAVRVLKGFPTPPLGLEPRVAAKIPYSPQVYGDGWALAPKDYLGYGSMVWALQGCVYYPVDVTQLNLEQQQASVVSSMNQQILLDFPVGQLEFTPGRETLSYTPSTVANLRQRWGVFAQEITERFEREMADCSTDFERAVAVERRNLKGLFSGLFKLSPYYKRVKAVNQAIEAVLPYDLRSWDQESGQLVGAFTVVDCEGRSARCKYRSKNCCPTSALEGDQPVVFVERQPRVSSPWKRVGHYLKQTGAKFAICWREHDPEDKESVLVDPAMFGNPPVLRVCDMPLPPLPLRHREKHGWRRYRVKLGQRYWEFIDSAESLPEKPLYLYEYDQIIVQPQPNGPAKEWPVLYDLSQARRYIQWQEATGGRPIVIVRLRANEVLHRWRNLPVYTPPTEDEVVQALRPAEVAQIVNLRNQQNFENSYYSRALAKYRQELCRDPRSKRKVEIEDPISKLSRFQDRAHRVPGVQKKKLEAVGQYITWMGWEQIIQRALSMGLEVLPEPSGMYGRMPWPLLPLHWENLARMLAETRSARYSLAQLLECMRHCAETSGDQS